MRLFNLIFGCTHQNESRVFTIIKPRKQYVVCLTCGQERDYDFDRLGEIPVVFAADAKEEIKALERMLAK